MPLSSDFEFANCVHLYILGSKFCKGIPRKASDHKKSLDRFRLCSQVGYAHPESSKPSCKNKARASWGANAPAKLGAQTEMIQILIEIFIF